MAFIFQAYNLIDYLTPAENVSLTSKLPPLPILERLGLTKEEAKRNVQVRERVQDGAAQPQSRRNNAPRSERRAK